jgi:hypothetical protein
VRVFLDFAKTKIVEIRVFLYFQGQWVMCAAREIPFHMI